MTLPSSGCHRAWDGGVGQQGQGGAYLAGQGGAGQECLKVVSKMQAALVGVGKALSGNGDGVKRISVFDKALAMLAEGEDVAREIGKGNKES